MSAGHVVIEIQTDDPADGPVRAWGPYDFDTAADTAELLEAGALQTAGPFACSTRYVVVGLVPAPNWAEELDEDFDPDNR